MHRTGREGHIGHAVIPPWLDVAEEATLQEVAMLREADTAHPEVDMDHHQEAAMAPLQGAVMGHEVHMYKEEVPWVQAHTGAHLKACRAKDVHRQAGTARLKSKEAWHRERAPWLPAQAQEQQQVR